MGLLTAGFILGFDSEPAAVDETLVDFIEESGIILAMVGLLFALQKYAVDPEVDALRAIDFTRSPVVD